MTWDGLLQVFLLSVALGILRIGSGHARLHLFLVALDTYTQMVLCAVLVMSFTFSFSKDVDLLLVLVSIQKNFRAVYLWF